MKLSHTLCPTCRGIRSGRLVKPWVDHYFHALEPEGVPYEVLLDAEMEMLHATHHDDSALRAGEAVLMLGFRVILAHYLEAGTVPRQEMVHALNDQAGRHLERIDAEKQAAREQIREEHGAQMHELKVRLANVDALVSWAFHHGRRKTMRTEQVRAAIEWRTGDPIPEVTVAEHQRTRSAIAAGQPWRRSEEGQADGADHQGSDGGAAVGG